MSIRWFLGSVFAMVWGLCLSGAPPIAAQGPETFRIVVHESNSVESLDRRAVSKIFLRKVTLWPDGTPVEPVDQEAISAVRAAFSRVVHGKSVSVVNNFWQRMIFSGSAVPPHSLSSDAAVLDFVASRRGAIGYVSASTPLGAGVRALTLWDLDSGGFRSEPDPGSDGFRSEPDPGSGGFRSESEPRVLQPPRRALLQSIQGSAGLLVWAGPVSGGLFLTRDGGASWEPAEDGLGDRRIRGFVASFGSSEVLALADRSIYRASFPGAKWFFSEAVSQPLQLLVSPWDPAQLFLLTGSGLLRRDGPGEPFRPVEVEGRPFLDLWMSPHFGLLASDGETLWRGTRTGDRWSFASRLHFQGRVFDLAAVPDRPGLLLAATSGGVLVGQERNRGQFWERTPLTGSFHAVLVTSRAWLAADRQGLYASSDSGSTWQPVASIRNAALAIASASGDRVLALGSDGHLIGSLDGGWSWRREQRLNPPARPPQEVLSVEAERRKRLDIPPRSVTIHLACGADREHVAAIVVDPHDSSRVYAAGQAGVFRSSDFGTTWQDASSGLDIRDVHALAIDPKNPEILYAGTHGAGVFKSSDGASSWWPIRRGLSDLVIHSLRVDPAVPSLLQAGTPSGLFGTSNGGESWRLLERGLLAFPSLVSDTRDLNRWLAGSGHGKLWLGSSASLEGVFRDAAVGVPNSSLVSPTELCRGGQTRSTGRRFLASLGIEPAGLRVRSCGFDPEAEPGLFAGTGLGLFRSEDLGRTWRRLPLDANLAALSIVRAPGKDSETLLLAGTAKGLWRGEQGGESWRRLPFHDPVVSVATDPALPSVIYAGSTGSRLGVSRDGGESWSRALLAVPPSALAKQAAGPRARRGKAPAEVTAAGERLWRALWQIPPERPRHRALVATELLVRAPVKLRGEVRKVLERFLEDLRGVDRDLEPYDVSALGFSPAERWLLVRHGSDSCRGCAPQLRLFDLERKRFRHDEPPPSAERWMQAHDLSLEPHHLLPRWRMDDPGELLAWGPEDRYVATRSQAGGARVWDLGRGSSPEDARGTPAPAEPWSFPWRLDVPVSLCPGRAEPDSQKASEVGCEVALSGDGRRLAYVVETSAGASVRLARRLRDRTQVEEVWTLPTDEEKPIGWKFLRFTPDSSRLLGFASDGSLWMAPGDGPPVSPDPVFVDEPRPGGREAWRAIAFDRMGRWLAAIGRDTVWLWRISGSEGLEEPESLEMSGPLEDLGFSPDGRWLAVETSHGETTIFELEPDVRKARRWVHTVEGWPGAFSHESSRWISYGTPPRSLRLETGSSQIIGRGNRRAVPSLGREQQTRRDTLLREREEASGQPMRLLSLQRRWLASHRRHDFYLWDLSDRPPRYLHGQIERPWPSTSAEDKSPERQAPIPWPEGSLADLGTEALRDLACAVVRRNLTPTEWRLWVGEEPWKATCRWPGSRAAPENAKKAARRLPERSE